MFKGLLFRMPRGCSDFIVMKVVVKFLDVIVQAKDRASQEESLGDVHERAVGHVSNVKDLEKCKCYAAHDKQHSTSITYNECFHFVVKNRFNPRPDCGRLLPG